MISDISNSFMPRQKWSSLILANIVTNSKFTGVNCLNIPFAGDKTPWCSMNLTNWGSEIAKGKYCPKILHKLN